MFNYYVPASLKMLGTTVNRKSDFIHIWGKDVQMSKTNSESDSGVKIIKQGDVRESERQDLKEGLADFGISRPELGGLRNGNRICRAQGLEGRKAAGLGITRGLASRDTKELEFLRTKETKECLKQE